MKLSRDDIRALCDVLNAYQEVGPVADEDSFWSFSVAFLRLCLLRAMTESVAEEADDVWTRGTEYVGGVHLSWARAREIEATLYDHAVAGVKYLSDLRGQDLRVALELEFSPASRRIIKAYLQTSEEGREEDSPVLASEVGPATRAELELFVDEVVDQRLDWLAEDHDDLPPEEG